MSLSGKMAIDDDHDDQFGQEPELGDNIESKYITEEELFEFHHAPSSDAKKFSFNLININCRSLRANFSEIENHVINSKVNYSVIVVTETWLNEINQDIFQIEGYKFFSKHRNGAKSGGGVGIYVNNCFDTKVRHDLSISAEYLE